MKKLFVVIIFFMIIILPVIPQGDTKRETTTLFPENGKYEIITSPITMRDTYMLNRETGNTWQLVTTTNGYAWDEIHREKNTDDVIPKGHSGAVYQITMSGIAAKGIYLTNTLTGATWCLYSDSQTGILFWGVIEFPK